MEITNNLSKYFKYEEQSSEIYETRKLLNKLTIVTSNIEINNKNSSGIYGARECIERICKDIESTLNKMRYSDKIIYHEVRFISSGLCDQAIETFKQGLSKVNFLIEIRVIYYSEYDYHIKKSLLDIIGTFGYSPKLIDIESSNISF
jgi:hypothetical protein